MDKKRSRMSLWRLMKKILEQAFRVGLQPVQGGQHPPCHVGLGMLPAPHVQCHSWTLCSTVKVSPSGWGDIAASILQEKLRQRTQEKHKNSGQIHQAFWLADTFHGNTPSPTRCSCFLSRERGSDTSVLERHLSFSEVACLLSLWIGRDWRYFELKKALVFLYAIPSSSPHWPVSLTHTHFCSGSPVSWMLHSTEILPLLE